jgi:hypothetical protein
LFKGWIDGFRYEVDNIITIIEELAWFFIAG